MNRTTTLRLIATTTALLACACSGAPEDATADEGISAESAALTGPTTLAYSSPSGLVSSTGNLYWTSYAIDELGPDSATVWRASKSNVPGQERALYRESGDRSGFYFFGNIVWAYTNDYYGYFVANYNDNGVPTSYIKRVPLAGGAATVLAKSPAYVGTRDLATDGTTLFWADASGIQRMPIGGGTVTTMYHGQKCSRIGLDSSSIYFSDGPYIARGSKTGGASGWETATSTVTALSVNEATRTVYWGEAGGAVRSRGYDSLVTAVVQAPIAGRDVTSVGFDGNRVLWTDCAEPGNTSCDVRYRPLGGWTSIVNVGTVGAGHLQWDSASLYWGDASALKKAVY